MLTCEAWEEVEVDWVVVGACASGEGEGDGVPEETAACFAGLGGCMIVSVED